MHEFILLVRCMIYWCMYTCRHLPPLSFKAWWVATGLLVTWLTRSACLLIPWWCLPYPSNLCGVGLACHIRVRNHFTGTWSLALHIIRSCFLSASLILTRGATCTIGSEAHLRDQSALSMTKWNDDSQGLKLTQTHFKWTKKEDIWKNTNWSPLTSI